MLRRSIERAIAARLIRRDPQLDRLEQFGTVPPRRRVTVFLGDSIIEGGLWAEWFPDRRVQNRGTGGERTDQILNRVKAGIDEPVAVFLLAGTNDLSFGVPPADIANRLCDIVDALSAVAPACRTFVQSVMPRHRAYAPEILDINARLKIGLDARGTAEYVDLWPALATSQASLRPEFTRDELHLNGRGYAAWVDVLRPLVRSLSDDPEQEPLGTDEE